jgi:hypothetical protein
MYLISAAQYNHPLESIGIGQVMNRCRSKD